MTCCCCSHSWSYCSLCLSCCCCSHCWTCWSLFTCWQPLGQEQPRQLWKCDFPAGGDEERQQPHIALQDLLAHLGHQLIAQRHQLQGHLQDGEEQLDHEEDPRVCRRQPGVGRLLQGRGPRCHPDATPRQLPPQRLLLEHLRDSLQRAGQVEGVHPREPLREHAPATRKRGRWRQPGAPARGRGEVLKGAPA